MKKYFAYFRMRFSAGIQYRAAALAGIATQFAWGFMQILGYRAFYTSNPNAFPMTFEATVSYVWLQQAFVALFMSWIFEHDLLESVIKGDVAYDLTRPINLYYMWFSRTLANRVSKAVLRCFPILIFAVFMPAPFKLVFPANAGQLSIFLISGILGTLLVVAITMIVYISGFYTISNSGVYRIFLTVSELFNGSIIPISFYPSVLRQLCEWLPFASVQNTPFRIFSGDLAGDEMILALLLQLFWLAAIVIFGKWLGKRALKRVVVQGG